MASKRIEYIDWLKGLSIMWVVWFHAPHPEFVNFSFRMPLFFLLSGIFFKVIPMREHIVRKTNQLVVPFIFFYLLYAIYLIAEWRWSPTHAGQELDYSLLLTDLFARHRGATCYIVNPPLWFISALLNVQLILWILVRCLRRRWAVMCAAILISVAGILYMEHHGTPLMIGRCMRFVGYYTFGHLYGKDILRLIERSTRSMLTLLTVAVAVMALMAPLTFGLTQDHNLHEAGMYLFNIALVIALIILFRYVSRVHALRFFHFYGRNSYVVLGVHYIFIQIFYIIMITCFGRIDDSGLGLIATLLTLLLLVPVIKGCNRYIPTLIGKKELIPSHPAAPHRLSPLNT